MVCRESVSIAFKSFNTPERAYRDLLSEEVEIFVTILEGRLRGAELRVEEILRFG